MFPRLHEKITEAVSRLEEQIATVEGDSSVPADEVAKAKEALELGKAVGEPAVV